MHGKARRSAKRSSMRCRLATHTWAVTKSAQTAWRHFVATSEVFPSAWMAMETALAANLTGDGDRRNSGRRGSDWRAQSCPTFRHPSVTEAGPGGDWQLLSAYTRERAAGGDCYAHADDEFARVYALRKWQHKRRLNAYQDPQNRMLRQAPVRATPTVLRQRRALQSARAPCRSRGNYRGGCVSGPSTCPDRCS